MRESASKRVEKANPGSDQLVGNDPGLRPAGRKTADQLVEESRDLRPAGRSFPVENVATPVLTTGRVSVAVARVAEDLWGEDAARKLAERTGQSYRAAERQIAVRHGHASAREIGTEPYVALLRSDDGFAFLAAVMERVPPGGAAGVVEEARRQPEAGRDPSPPEGARRRDRGAGARRGGDGRRPDREKETRAARPRAAARRAGQQRKGITMSFEDVMPKRGGARATKPPVRVGMWQVKDADARLWLQIGGEVLDLLGDGERCYRVALGKGEDKHLLRIIRDDEGPFRPTELGIAKGGGWFRFLLAPDTRFPVIRVDLVEAKYEVRTGKGAAQLLVTLPAWGWDEGERKRVEGAKPS